MPPGKAEPFKGVVDYCGATGATQGVQLSQLLLVVREGDAG